MKHFVQGLCTRTKMTCSMLFKMTDTLCGQFSRRMDTQGLGLIKNGYACFGFNNNMETPWLSLIKGFIYGVSGMDTP